MSVKCTLRVLIDISSCFPREREKTQLAYLVRLKIKCFVFLRCFLLDSQSYVVHGIIHKVALTSISPRFLKKHYLARCRWFFFSKFVLCIRVRYYFLFFTSTYYFPRCFMFTNSNIANVMDFSFISVGIVSCLYMCVEFSYVDALEV